MTTWPEIKITKWTDLVNSLEFLALEKDYLSHWAFRGQSDSSWTLKSSVLMLLERHNIGRTLGAKFERTIFREFIAKAHLFEDFKTREFKTGNTVVTFTIMQHYGSPTRLLDWTTSPYVALYFAVNNDFSRDGAVYLFNQTLLNKLNDDARFNNDEEFFNDQESDHIQTFMTNFSTRRLNSQQGLFTIAANVDKDHHDLINKSLISKNKNQNYSSFVKLVIDKEVKHEFLARLRTLNLRADQLFPDLYGFSASLKDLLEIRGWEKRLV